MTTEPLLQPAVAKKLQRLSQQPPHALLLTGEPGSGKATISRWLTAQLLGISLTALDTYPYLSTIEPEKGTIGVDAVRTLEHIVALKTPASDKAINRVVIIQDAHLLTHEAQNALLKTLEEPPAGTMLLLTASRADALLPTVLSRLQLVDIGRPDTDALRTLLQEHGLSTTEITRIMALSGGLPGLAIALAQGDDTHPLVQAANTARALLQQSSFERLSTVDALAKDRDQARNVTYILMQMAHAALLTGRGPARWQKVLQASYDAETALSQNAQAKLVLTNLMLNL